MLINILLSACMQFSIAYHVGVTVSLPYSPSTMYPALDTVLRGMESSPVPVVSTPVVSTNVLPTPVVSTSTPVSTPTELSLGIQMNFREGCQLVDNELSIKLSEKMFQPLMTENLIDNGRKWTIVYR